VLRNLLAKFGCVALDAPFLCDRQQAVEDDGVGLECISDDTTNNTAADISDRSDQTLV
jgi:hypothetical protein